MSCPTGATVKPGISAGTYVLVSRSAWEALIGGPSSWFDFLLEIYGPKIITAGALCALNPDDPPFPNLLTVAQAFLRDPSSILSLARYVRDKLTYVQFSLYCV